MTISDEQLIKGCLKRDANSQRALYEKYKLTMFRICLRYAKDKPEAEDILQDGFIKVFQDLKQYNGKGQLGGWIRKVIVNTALQHIRKNKKLFSTVEIDNASDMQNMEEDIFSSFGVKTLTKMIQQLPPGYKLVFNMYVIEGYSHKEIAEKLNITSSTSKSQLSKAKATLRKKLEKAMIS